MIFDHHSLRQRRRALSPFGIAGALCVAAFILGIGASPAAAFGYAPNPGFETDCAGVPCDWSAFQNATITRDTSVDHTGVASVRVTHVNPSASPADVRSTCLTGVAPGSYTASGWYRTTTPGVLANVNVAFYPIANCTGAVTAPLNAAELSAGGTAWHRVEAAGTAAVGTLSARITLSLSCSSCAPGTISNFDDVSLVSSIAPNPGFETNCAGVPCDWAAGANTTVTRDTSVDHTGQASIRVAITNTPSNFAEAQGTCIAGISPGSYTVSAWRRSTTTGIRVSVGASFYPTSSCSGAPTGTLEGTGLTVDQSWHRMEAAGTAGAGTQFVRISLGLFCGTPGGCAAVDSVNFDDVSLVSSIAPNPGFETNCAGVPCDWTTTINATAARDVSTTHAGAASIGVNYTNPSAGSANVVGTCVTGVSPGSYTLSGFYRTTTADVLPDIIVSFFSTSTCSGSGTGIHAIEVSAGDTSWHFLESAGVAPAGTQSARFVLTLTCVGCTAGTKVNFDDLTLTGGAPSGPPTAAVVRAFDLEWSREGVRLSWRTAAETGIAAFRVWRNGKRLTQVGSKTRGSVGGAAYHYLDRTARRDRAYAYTLEVIGVDGRRMWRGAARATPRP